jgi:hypothetical protein
VTPSPKRSEFLAGLVLASDAGHGLSPLDFCGETGHNRVPRSRAWVTPRFGLAPASASTETGVLISGYVLGWWFDRDFYGVTGSECDLDADYHAGFVLPESPVDAGLSYLAPKSFLFSGIAQTFCRFFSRQFRVVRLFEAFRSRRLISHSHALKRRYAAPVEHLPIARGFRVQVIRCHPSQSRSDRSQRIRFVLSEVESNQNQIVAYLRGCKPLLLVRAKHQLDGIQKAGVLFFHFCDFFLIELLFLLGDQRKCGDNQLREFGDFYIDFVAALSKFIVPLYQVSKQRVVVSGRL